MRILNSKSKCGNCMYFEAGGSSSGYCLLNPPAVVYDPNLQEDFVKSFVPETSGESWCGQWRSVEYWKEEGMTDE